MEKAKSVRGIEGVSSHVRLASEGKKWERYEPSSEENASASLLKTQ